MRLILVLPLQRRAGWLLERFPSVGVATNRSASVKRERAKGDCGGSLSAVQVVLRSPGRYDVPCDFEEFNNDLGFLLEVCLFQFR